MAIWFSPSLLMHGSTYRTALKTYCQPTIFSLICQHCSCIITCFSVSENTNCAAPQILATVQREFGTLTPRSATIFMVHQTCRTIEMCRTIRFDDCFILVQQVKHTNCPICRGSPTLIKRSRRSGLVLLTLQEL